MRQFEEGLVLKRSSKLRVRKRMGGLYQAISAKRAIGVKIPKSLCFYNPTQVLSALETNHNVRGWLEFISNHHIPEPAKVLLIYPCSAQKPYHRSRSYGQLFSTLEELGDQRKSVKIATISEPFGLVPEKFYSRNTKWRKWKTSWYDCPGLFEWFCNKYGLEYSEEDLDSSIEILAGYVARFLKKASDLKSYTAIMAVVRTYSSSLQKRNDHTHRRIIERASEKSGVKVRLFPSKRLVAKVVAERGRLAWDMYGVSHPIVQRAMLKELRLMLNDKN